MLERRICGVTAFLAFVYWASLTLSFFGLRTPLITDTEEVVRAKLAIGTLNISLQQILVFLATIWAAFATSRFLRFLLDEDIYHHWHLARGVPQAISAVVHYAVLRILCQFSRAWCRPYQGYDSGWSVYRWRWIRVTNRYQQFRLRINIAFRAPD